MTNAHILGGEVAGHVYVSVMAGQQDVPIAINGGNNIGLDGVSFENNGGNGAIKANDVIRTGYNGDSQTDGATNTDVLTI